jgi:hypothetical protein
MAGYNTAITKAANKGVKVEKAPGQDEMPEPPAGSGGLDRTFAARYVPNTARIPAKAGTNRTAKGVVPNKAIAPVVR